MPEVAPRAEMTTARGVRSRAIVRIFAEGAVAALALQVEAAKWRLPIVSSHPLLELAQVGKPRLSFCQGTSHRKRLRINAHNKILRPEPTSSSQNNFGFFYAA